VATPEPVRRGLLVDWGGVLTTDLFASFGRFCTEEGLAPEAARDAFMSHPLARELLEDFECGRMGSGDFEQRFGAVLGVAEPTGLIGRLFAHVRPDDVMQDAVAAFRAAGVRTGLLSNSWGTDTYDRRRFAGMFDVLVISGEEGVRKPTPELYATAVARMGMAADELVFVDDLRGNLKPARALGIATVHHTDAAATIAELEELLGVAVSV
jgi:epoxide hydrolase-like predicted phosphatase